MDCTRTVRVIKVEWPEAGGLPLGYWNAGYSLTAISTSPCAVASTMVTGPLT